jgi:hypothetical protein
MEAPSGRTKLTPAQLKTLRKRKAGDPDPGLRDVDLEGKSLKG